MLDRGQIDCEHRFEFTPFDGVRNTEFERAVDPPLTGAHLIEDFQGQVQHTWTGEQLTPVCSAKALEPAGQAPFLRDRQQRNPSNG